jgi:hypothetical protein
MFKNFLTYEWAIRFQSQIQAQSELAPKRKDRALKSSALLVHHLSRAVHSENGKDAARHYCVSVMCLRDAWEEIAAEKDEISERQASRTTLVTQSVDGSSRVATLTFPEWVTALEGVFRTLEHRLVELTEKASSVENGQFRMLG